MFEACWGPRDPFSNLWRVHPVIRCPAGRWWKPSTQHSGHSPAAEPIPRSGGRLCGGPSGEAEGIETTGPRCERANEVPRPGVHGVETADPMNH